MHPWITEFLRLAHLLLARPETHNEFMAGIAAGAIGLILAMRLTSSAFGLKLNGWLVSFLMAVITLVVVFASVCALRMYILKPTTAPLVRLIAQGATAGLVTLIVVVPLQCLIQRGSYLESFLATATAIVAMVLIVVAFRAAWHAAAGGKLSSERMRTRNQAMEADMDNLPKAAPAR